VALFATQLFQLKAQIMCGKFAPETMIQIAGVAQLTPEDQQLVPQALQLLLGERATNPDAESEANPLRIFRIEVNSDTMVQIDEQAEKENRMQFLQANGDFMDKATKMMMQAGPAASVLGPVIMDLWKFGITGFRVGRTIEGTLDAAADKIKQLAAQPPPQQPNPEMMKIQAQQQADAARLQHDQQVEAAAHQREQERTQMEMQAKAQTAQMEAQSEERKAAIEAQRESFKLQAEMDFKRWEAELKARTEIEIAEINAAATLQGEQAKAAAQASAGKDVAEAKAKESSKPALPDIHVHMPSGNKKIKKTGDGQYESSDA
jgi:hypothetical protein